MIAVITRTYNRPKYFERCLASITSQVYSGSIYHVVIDNNPPEKSYVQSEIRGNYTRRVISVPRVEKGERTLEYSGKHLYHAPWNVNMNVALYDIEHQIEIGNLPEHTIILMMDDDDCYLRNDAFRVISEAAIMVKPPFMLFWRVKFATQIVPCDSNFGNAPVLCDISTLGFAHTPDLIKYSKWDNFSCGDFRTANEMYPHAKHIYINSILTGLQRSNNNGLGKGDDLC